MQNVNIVTDTDGKNITGMQNLTCSSENCTTQEIRFFS